MTTPPLLVASAALVQAFDASSGQPLWSRRLSAAGLYVRIAASLEIAVVAVDNHAYVLDARTGALLIDTELWFHNWAAVAHADALVLCGDRGLACFDRTGYRWGVRSSPLPGGLFERNAEFWIENARGERVAKLDSFVPWLAPRATVGLVFGTSVFQPDTSG